MTSQENLEGDIPHEINEVRVGSLKTFTFFIFFEVMVMINNKFTVIIIIVMILIGGLRTT